MERCKMSYQNYKCQKDYKDYDDYKYKKDCKDHDECKCKKCYKCYEEEEMTHVHEYESLSLIHILHHIYMQEKLQLQ